MSRSEDRDQDGFRQLVDTASCMIVILRRDQSIAFFNSYAERLTGYSAAEVIGQDYSSLFLPDSERATEAREVERLFDGGGGGEKYERPVRGRSGDLSWLEWSTRVLDDFEGSPGLLAVGHDITDRKQAITNLRNQEARLRAVLNTAVDGIITINKHGIIQSVNSAGERIFGYTVDEMVGKNVSMLMPSPFREEHDDYLANYLRTGVKKIIGLGREVIAVRKDGTTFPCDLAVSEVPLADQMLFTGFIRDISETKRAKERALQAERLAAIGQTVAGLAHESRNAFQRSQACLEMLALELEGQPVELQLVERTQRALDHLHRLYEEVRDYAAPITLERQPCNIAHLWRDSWSQLEISRRDKRLELMENIATEELFCNVDRFAVGQVFRNVFENSLAACPEGGKIEVSSRSCTLHRESAIQISIRDSGPGIAPAMRDQVFDAFFTTKTKGTGLGMAIARRIVEAHGGTIVVGNPDSGAEFVLELPCL